MRRQIDCFLDLSLFVLSAGVIAQNKHSSHRESSFTPDVQAEDSLAQMASGKRGQISGQMPLLFCSTNRRAFCVSYSAGNKAYGASVI
jgi:hypothetical protein